jgi:hypothetical protein
MSALPGAIPPEAAADPHLAARTALHSLRRATRYPARSALDSSTRNSASDTFVPTDFVRRA